MNAPRVEQPASSCASAVVRRATMLLGPLLAIGCRATPTQRAPSDAPQPIAPAHSATPTPPATTPAPATTTAVLRTAYHHAFTIEGDDGAPLVDIRCLTIEVLREEADRTRVRVRMDDTGVVHEGWVDGPVASRGAEDCPARVLSRRRSAGYVIVDGARREFEPDPLPPGYRMPAAQPPALSGTGALWWLSRDTDDDTWVCRRWEFVRTRRTLELQHETDRGQHAYRVELGAGTVTLFGPAWRSRDSDGSRWTAGCVQTLWLVDGDDSHFAMVPSFEHVTAYHGDDTQLWYRTEQSCRDAGQAGAAGFGGC